MIYAVKSNILHTYCISIADVMCPLIQDLAAASVCCGPSTLKVHIKACVFYIWQAPDPGPPALTMHLSKTIRFPTVSAWIFLGVREEKGKEIKSSLMYQDRDSVCLWPSYSITKCHFTGWSVIQISKLVWQIQEIARDTERDWLDLVSLHATASCTGHPDRQQGESSLHLAYVGNANPGVSHWPGLL